MHQETAAGNVQVLAGESEQQLLAAQLASLLEIDIGVAQRALQRCQWKFEVAVNIACDLISTEDRGSSASSSSERVHPVASMDSVQPSPPVPLDAGHSQRSAAPQEVCPAQPASSSQQAPMRHSQSSAVPEEVCPAQPASSSQQAPMTVSNSVIKRSHSSLADDEADVFSSASGSSAAKKRRSENVGDISSPATFPIPNNKRDPPSVNPPLFQAHPLREEQRRSLGWMVSQEAGLRTGSATGGIIRGGLLADRMGYGKTSTAIGLISLGSEARMRTPGEGDVPRLTEGGYVPSDSTLIVCPSHLVDQWKGEFLKFLGSTGVEISEPQDGDFASRNSQQITSRIKCANQGDLKGILVESISKTWTKIPSIRIANIKEDDLQHLSFEGSKKPKKGDYISKITCQRLQGDDGKSYNKTLTDYHRIRSVLRGQQFDHTYQVQDGYETVHGINGPCQMKRYRTIYTKLSFTVESTLTFSIVRLKSEIPRTKVVEGTGQFRILALRDEKSLGILDQKEFISQFHVILASARIHSSQKYSEYIKDACGKGGLMALKMKALRGKVATWCASIDTFKSNVLQRSPALFEIIYWKRVIFDEFHESETWEYRVREMLKSLGATHKWGLSGTPPLGSAAAVVEVAGLLGYASPSKDGNILEQAVHYLSHNIVKTAATAEWASSKANQISLNRSVQQFVDDCIRQNTSELIEQIAIVEHEVVVEHTPEERLIYRQACHDQGIFDLADGYSDISLDARAELLKRCAHFDMGQTEDSVGSAITSLGSRKREWLDSLEKQLWVEVARIRLFKLWDTKGQDALRSAVMLHDGTKAMVERLLASSEEDAKEHLAKATSSPEGNLDLALRLEVKMTAQDGALRLRPEVKIVQPVRENQYLRDDRQRHLVVHSIARRARNFDAASALSELAICEHACTGRLDEAFSRGMTELVSLLDKAHRSLQFYTHQVNSLSNQQDCPTECSICLEDMADISKTAILPCSHMFHTSCIRDVLAANPHCPECRQPVERSHVSSVVMELKPPEPEPETPRTVMTEAWKQHGSKLNAVAYQLREIRKQDAHAKALIFVQWADLEAKAWRALHDHGIRFLHLSSNSILAKEDGATLRRFQEETSEDAPYALVLSLQRAAAGTNLTSANHVFFVHPMNAETVSTAAAFERQALARVRRIGQARKEVHVWRFVTKQTIEEHIWKLHCNAPGDVEADQGDAGTS